LRRDKMTENAGLENVRKVSKKVKKCIALKSVKESGFLEWLVAR